MKTCPYCKEEVREDALKCRYCQSSLVAAQPESADKGNVTYVVDRDLVRFGKFALSVLGIFTVVGLFLFGFRLNDMASQLTKAREDLVEAQSNLDSAQANLDTAQAIMNSRLEQLQMSSVQVENLQKKTEDLVERAERSINIIEERESRSKELLIAMQTFEGGSSVVVTTTTTDETQEWRLNGKLWQNGSVLKVGFMGGDEIIHETVRELANEWTDYANLQLDFIAEPEEAVIRISFEVGSGSWSYVGTDALDIAAENATMNINPNWPREQLRGSILSNFGHALGLLNEHQNPNAEIPWDEETVYAFYSEPPNFWSQAVVYRNLLERWPEGYFGIERAYDRDSVMHPAIDNALTVGDFETTMNSELSEGDKAWIEQLYPKDD